MLLIKRGVFIGYVLLIIEMGFLILFDLNNSYFMWACLSIVQLIFHIIIVNKFSKTRILSLPIVFLFLANIFHCGHIYNLGFKIPGELNLNFVKYANPLAQREAFKFCLFSQVFLCFGILFCKQIYKIKKSTSYIDMSRSSKTLVSIGLIPRFYVDAIKLISGIKYGYKGVYSLLIPQPINSLAFFFDVGVIISLLQSNNKKKKLLFISILIYKSLVMISGARQGNVGFLIVWVFIYLFIVNKSHLKNSVILMVLIVGGIVLIETIGETRQTGSFSLDYLFTFFTRFKFENIIGNVLGEYGSAFTSVVVPFQQIPLVVSFGYGKSYLAGILSVFPLLVSYIPFLKSQTTYITLFKGTIFFGGSMFGEAFYNFGWYGILVSFVIGLVIKRTDLITEKTIYKKYCPIEYVMAFVILISLITYVRGYFTDMMQKTIWVYIALRLINLKNKDIDERIVKI